jgi:hypothetical protein
MVAGLPAVTVCPHHHVSCILGQPFIGGAALKAKASGSDISCALSLLWGFLMVLKGTDDGLRGALRGLCLRRGSVNVSAELGFCVILVRAVCQSMHAMHTAAAAPARAGVRATERMSEPGFAGGAAL